MTNTTDSKNDRFAGALGDKYALIQKGLPYYLDMQKAIAVEVHNGLRALTGNPLTVLDLGCGTGITTLALGEELTNVKITGVDKGPTMLKQYDALVRKHEAELQGKGVTITMIEKDALEFLKGCEDATFDVVASGFTLHNISKDLRPQIAMEIGRVLRPQGRFVNADKIARDDEKLHQKDLMDQIAKFVECYGNPAETAYGLDWIEHYIRDNQPDLRQTESEVRDTLSKAGFGKIQIIERHGMDALVIADRLA